MLRAPAPLPTFRLSILSLTISGMVLVKVVSLDTAEVVEDLGTGLTIRTIILHLLRLVLLLALRGCGEIIPLPSRSPRGCEEAIHLARLDRVDGPHLGIACTHIPLIPLPPLLPLPLLLQIHLISATTTIILEVHMIIVTVTRLLLRLPLRLQALQVISMVYSRVLKLILSTVSILMQRPIPAMHIQQILLTLRTPAESLLPRR